MSITRKELQDLDNDYVMCYQCKKYVVEENQPIYSISLGRTDHVKRDIITDSFANVNQPVMVPYRVNFCETCWGEIAGSKYSFEDPRQYSDEEGFCYTCNHIGCVC